MSRDTREHAPLWSPASWKKYPARQQPTYSDAAALREVLQQLRQLPPLVHNFEIEQLKHLLAEAAQGRRFLLHAGDCAERFRADIAPAVSQHVRILAQMSAVLHRGLHVPVIRVGRIAGQFAKPRSTAFERIGESELPVYRGDLINAHEAELPARMPDPQRMLRGYAQAAATLKLMRALETSAEAYAHQFVPWHTKAISRNTRASLRKGVRDQASGDAEPQAHPPRRTLGPLAPFVSHECLLLCYEEQLTRRDHESARDYNFGAHMLWLGDRTRQLQGAHVEYLRGVANPIGIKIGPSCSPEELLALLRVLNPMHAPGRITLITRLGAGRIAHLLPPLIAAVQKCRAPVLWSCDPMHGNTTMTPAGWKTRAFDDILEELRLAFMLHREHGSCLGGVHLELTGEHVTECLGGTQALSEKDLAENYESACDPRLNYVQSLELAFEIVGLQQAQQRTGPPSRAVASED